MATANTGATVKSSEEEFCALHKEAYSYVSEGLQYIADGRNEDASESLQKGLYAIDEALRISPRSLNLTEEMVMKYQAMKEKMIATRKEILDHLAAWHSVSQEIKDCPASTADMDALSIYPNLDEICQDGELIFKIDDGVKIFFIHPDGTVTSPPTTTFLAVFIFSKQLGKFDTRGFLQVGKWTYPLIPEQSPALSTDGSYMFPDFIAPELGTTVGIVLPDSTGPDDRKIFEDILSHLTCYKDHKALGIEDKEKGSISQSMSYGFVYGAQKVSDGVIWGAEYLNGIINYGSKKLCEKVQPNEEQWQIDPKWQTAAKVARNVSGAAVKVSGFLLSQVGKATVALGNQLAPHLQKHGTKAIQHITGQQEKAASDQIDFVMEVTAGTVKGISTIYMGLENAASILASSISNNTVKVVTHRYGAEAGSVTDNALHAVGQTAMAGYNMSSLGVKGIAKRAAKDTGKAVLHQYDQKGNPTE